MDKWSDVDAYVEKLFVPGDVELTKTLERSDEAGLPAIQVSAAQGKFLSLLAMALQARSILEIGTLGGYSTIWLARGLSHGGKVVTLEISQIHADVARANLESAGLSDLVEVRVGDAAESLQALVDRGEGPFDLIFLDADKVSYPKYLELCLQLSRPGTVMIADNVVREGHITDHNSADANVAGTRRFNEMLASRSDVDASIIQTVGVKGHDGFAFAVVMDGRRGKSLD